tara:strand:- start:209 stop:715 length:507 start_codon:yes stop_codon:yes gene_type:complete
MSGIVGSKLNIRGSGLVGSLGTDGQHLLSAGAGVTNIFETVTAAGASDSFYAYDMAAIASGDLVINTELHDDGGNYDASNGRYTAPSDGHYFFMFSVIGSGTAAEAYFKLNGTAHPNAGTNMCTYTSGGTSPGAGALVTALDAADYISVYSTANVAAGYIFFGGGKLY